MGGQSKWQSRVARRKMRLVVLVLETTSVIVCCKILELGIGRIVGLAFAE
jgi:hypothetical protein